MLLVVPPFVLSFFGIIVILGIAFALSSDRRAIRLRVVGAAFAMQTLMAALVLYVPWGKKVLEFLSGGVSGLLSFAKDGTNFIFGPLAAPEVGGNSFAISALPVIIFFAALISILYYIGVMQFIIRWVGGGIQKVTGISRVESLCAAANIFVGQSESPLVIRPYLSALTPSQLFCVMTVGMAGVAGTILAAYASMGIRIDYLLAASFMSAPGGILMAKMIMPDPIPSKGVTGDVTVPENPHDPATLAPADAIDVDDVQGAVAEEGERPANIIMAASEGAQTGVKLAVAVGAMVLAFVALVALANGILGGIGGLFGFPELTFQAILGTVFQPIMFLLGVPWDEAARAGGLFGEKIVLNEFVAFISLGKLQAGLSPLTVGIVTFALCGFANFASIAIQMAVTGSLAPNQKPMIAKLGLRALAAGSLSNLMSAALAGLFLGMAMG